MTLFFSFRFCQPYSLPGCAFLSERFFPAPFPKLLPPMLPFLSFHSLVFLPGLPLLIGEDDGTIVCPESGCFPLVEAGHSFPLFRLFPKVSLPSPPCQGLSSSSQSILRLCSAEKRLLSFFPPQVDFFFKFLSPISLFLLSLFFLIRCFLASPPPLLRNQLNLSFHVFLYAQQGKPEAPIYLPPLVELLPLFRVEA